MLILMLLLIALIKNGMIIGVLLCKNKSQKLFGSTKTFTDISTEAMTRPSSGKHFRKTISEFDINDKTNELTPNKIKKQKPFKLKKKRKVKRSFVSSSYTPIHVGNKLEKIKIISKGSMSYFLNNSMKLDSITEERLRRFRITVDGEDRKSRILKLQKVKNVLHRNRFTDHSHPISSKRK